MSNLREIYLSLCQLLSAQTDMFSCASAEQFSLFMLKREEEAVKSVGKQELLNLFYCGDGGWLALCIKTKGVNERGSDAQVSHVQDDYVSLQSA